MTLPRPKRVRGGDRRGSRGRSCSTRRSPTRILALTSASRIETRGRSRGVGTAALLLPILPVRLRAPIRLALCPAEKRSEKRSIRPPRNRRLRRWKHLAEARSRRKSRPIICRRQRFRRVKNATPGRICPRRAPPKSNPRRIGSGLAGLGAAGGGLGAAGGGRISRTRG